MRIKSIRKFASPPGQIQLNLFSPLAFYKKRFSINFIPFLLGSYIHGDSHKGFYRQAYRGSGLPHVKGFEVPMTDFTNIESVFSIFTGIVSLLITFQAEWTPDPTEAPISIATGAQQGAGADASVPLARRRKDLVAT